MGDQINQMTNSTMKIAIVGLDNAGKTSIIRTLNRTYDIGGSITPTKSVERTTFGLFGSEGVLWDFGGQQEYRSTYLKESDRYLSGIGYLYFVVDMQDPRRFPEALDYFKRIYEIIHNEFPPVIVSILYHKSDPEILEASEIPHHIQQLSLEFQGIVENLEIGFYRTSIFDPLNLMNAISLPILGSQPLYNIISMLMAEFAMDHSIEYMNLQVNELLELGSFRLKTPKQDFIKASLDFYKQFASVDATTKKNEYEFEGYKFVILNRDVLDYNYSLNYAYSSGNKDEVPNPDDLQGLLGQINQKFEEYRPALF